MSKYILLYSTHLYWASLHHAKELEIMEKHLAEGDNIVNVVCNMSVKACDVNLDGSRERCLNCIGRRELGKKVAGIKPKELVLKDTDQNADGLVYKRDFNTIDELKEIKYKNFDIGYAVCSSIIHFTLDARFDLEEKKDLIYTLSKDAIEVYETAVKLYKKDKPDLIYFFNGRFAHVRAILRAAQLCNVSFKIYEGGHNRHHYELFHNSTPHDLTYITNQIINGWEKAEPVTREKLATDYFVDRADGKETSGISFTANQDQQRMPENWDSNKTNIGIFNSSENEFESLGEEWKNPIYENQNDGIYKIVKDYQDVENVHFYLRVHPNLAGNDSSQVTGIRKNLSSFPNLTIIEADSKISSYTLLHECDKVLTFGSNMGIEGTFFGKIVIQAGKSFAWNLDCVHIPKSHQEAVEMLNSNLEPKPKENAMKYGYFMASFGIPYKFYEPNSVWWGSYKGVEIHKYKLPKIKIPRLILKFLPNNFGKKLQDKINMIFKSLLVKQTLFKNRYFYRAYR